MRLSAKGSRDPDGNELNYQWWQYQEADSYAGTIEIEDSERQGASFTVPADVDNRDTVHMICEVTDDGSLWLTRCQRVIVKVTAN